MVTVSPTKYRVPFAALAWMSWSWASPQPDRVSGEMVGDTVGEVVGPEVAGDSVGEVVGPEVVGEVVGCEVVGSEVVGDSVGDVVATLQARSSVTGTDLVFGPGMPPA